MDGERREIKNGGMFIEGNLIRQVGPSDTLPQHADVVLDMGGKVVSITRHSANPLRAHADASLVVCAHDPAPHVAQLLYRSALQSLLDFVFVLLCHANPDRHRQLGVNLERIEHLIDT